MATNHWSKILPDAILNKVLNAAFEATGMNRALLLGKSRRRKVVNARHAAMWVLCEHFGYSSTQVGEALERHHTSVLHGVNRIDGMIADGRPISLTVAKIQQLTSSDAVNGYNARAKFANKAGIPLENVIGI